jgi:hypothetical protein
MLATKGDSQTDVVSVTTVATETTDRDELQSHMRHVYSRNGHTRTQHTYYQTDAIST